jgi:hypothetical protein
MGKLPFMGLDAAGAVGDVGPIVDLEGTSCEFTVAAFSTGSPSLYIVTLDGSHDGVNWFGVMSVRGSTKAVESSETRFGATPSGSSYPALTITPHARYLRCRLAALNDGTGPTVTATVAVGKVY